jgi:hypothetical protein
VTSSGSGPRRVKLESPGLAPHPEIAALKTGEKTPPLIAATLCTCMIKQLHTHQGLISYFS